MNFVDVGFRPSSLVYSDLLLLRLDTRVPMGIPSEIVVRNSSVEGDYRALPLVLDVQLPLDLGWVLRLHSELSEVLRIWAFNGMRSPSSSHDLNGPLSVADVEAVVKFVTASLLERRVVASAVAAHFVLLVHLV